MKRSLWFAGLALMCVATFVLRVSSQARPPAPPKRPPDTLLQMSIAAATTGLAEPFKGITTNGRVESGLFPVAKSGVSTEPARVATDTFLARFAPAGLTSTDDGRTWTSPKFAEAASRLEVRIESAIGGVRVEWID